MKRISLAMIAIASVVLLGCDSNGSSDVRPSDVSWTDEQWATIKTLRPVDSGGYLYEMNYTADYKLDEVLALGASDMFDIITGIKNVILPKSQYNFPFYIANTSLGLGCTCFSAAAEDGGYILGRNYDFPPMDDHIMIIHTPQVKDANGKIVRHAVVGCADLSPVTNLITEERGYQDDKMKEFVLYSPYFILDGINDAGLMCGLMVLEYDGVFQKAKDGQKDLLNVLIPRLILDKCATVREATDLISSYAVQTMFAVNPNPMYCIDMHFVIADSTGDRVVVEWVGDDIKIMHADSEDLYERQGNNANYVLSTNFYLSKDKKPCPEQIKEIGFWRYETLKTQFNKLKDTKLTVTGAMDMCKSVRIMNNDEDAIKKMLEMTYLNPFINWEDKNEWPWITLWSEVYDTKTLSLMYCLREDYDKHYDFGLDYKNLF